MKSGKVTVTTKYTPHAVLDFGSISADGCDGLLVQQKSLHQDVAYCAIDLRWRFCPTDQYELE